MILHLRSLIINSPFFIVLVCLLSATAVAQQWEDVEGPYGGTYIDIISHNDSLVAAPYYRSFLLFGDAEGTRWRRVDMPTPSAEAFCLLSPGGGRLLAGSFGRVYRSDDEGFTWSESYVPDLGGAIVNDMTGVGDTLFACGGGVMLRSVDRGVRWTVLDGAPSASALLEHADVLWAGGVDGLYSSADRGMHWESALAEQDTVHALWNVNRTLFASITPGSPHWSSPLLRSINGGAQWAASPLWGPVATMTGYQGELYAGVKDPERVTTLYRSTDYGDSWQPWQYVGVPFPRDVWHLQPVPNGLLASLGGVGIWRFDDVNRDWRFATHGHFPVGVAKVAFHDSMIFAYSMKERFIAVKNQGSSVWQCILYPGNGRPGDMLLRGDTLILGGDGALLLSTDRGAHWETRDIPALDATIQALHVGADHRQWLLGPTEHELVLSYDGGQRWAGMIGSGTPKQWFALAEGSDPDASMITLSTDGVTHIDEQLNGQGVPALGTAYDVTQNGDVMLFCGESGLLRWDPVTRDVDTLYRQPAYAIEQSDGTVFAVATRDSGIVLHRSIEDRQGSPVRDGLPATGYAPPTVCRIALAWQDNTLYFGNCGLPGLWKYTVADIHTDIHLPQRPPENPVLPRIYPNPVASSATITMEASNDGYARLSIIDHLGRSVRTLHDGTLEHGMHTFTFTAADLPPGIYFIVRRAGKTTSMRSFLVLR
jgi:photosystem II stability/assembly factor-like uncharacterized protein